MPIDTKYDPVRDGGNPICDKCHAGLMVGYQRTIGEAGREVTIRGERCDRCGYVALKNDDDVWAAVGL